MNIHNFDSQNSLLNQFLSELRNVELQKDSMRFRKNMERIGEILGYELSKTLNYTPSNVETPLGTKNSLLLDNKLVLCSVLRAGLTLHQGLINYFDNAENAFISAYRHHPDANSNDFKIVVNYLAAPSLDSKTLVMIDPMLATGKTLENTYRAMRKHGIPNQIHIVSVLGSKKGVEYIQKVFPENTHLWIAAIDPDLSDRSYIIPGFGDAGDLAFGEKLKL